MKKLKRIIGSLLIFALLALVTCSAKVNQDNYLSSWTENAVAKNKIFEYVKNVTDTKSPDYIPENERIAVFDMDGTLFCETDPVYYEYMMLFDRIFEDNKKNGGKEELVKEINEALKTGYISHEFELLLSDSEYEYYLNMTVEEYKKYIKEFLNKKTLSYTNMLIKDALYKPMLEVVKYLQDNNFIVYVVSGTERNFVRGVVCDKLGISERNVIGMDFKYKAKNQNDMRNSDYQYTRGEDIIVADKAEDVNVRFHKVHEISEEIGIVPVLAFGNSISDGSMLEYTLSNEKYKTLGFMVICDDMERENGSPDKAKSVLDFSNEKAYITISMKNDWKTIYGDGVKKETNKINVESGGNAMNVKIKYMGQGTAKITTEDNKVIYIDPYAGDDYKASADLILQTHDHFDHSQLDLVSNRNADCKIITEKEALVNGEHKTFDLPFVKVIAVEAGNNKNHNTDKCVGYVLEFKNGIKVYFSGDTSKTNQMSKMANMNIDYAFFCTDGKYNMGNEEAAECAKLVNAKHNIPYHNDPGDGIHFSRKLAEEWTAPNKMIVDVNEEIELQK